MGKQILFVDDDALLRRLVRDMLEQGGYKVSLASSGKEGLASARTRLPDLILLDLMMPGMNGFEMCREIRRDPRFSSTPVIMLTAMSSADVNDQALAAGANMCVSKPFRPEELLDAVTVGLQVAVLETRPSKV